MTAFSLFIASIAIGFGSIVALALFSVIVIVMYPEDRLPPVPMAIGWFFILTISLSAIALAVSLIWMGVGVLM